MENRTRTISSSGRKTRREVACEKSLVLHPWLLGLVSGNSPPTLEVGS